MKADPQHLAISRIFDEGIVYVKESRRLYLDPDCIDKAEFDHLLDEGNVPKETSELQTAIEKMRAIYAQAMVGIGWSFNTEERRGTTLGGEPIYEYFLVKYGIRIRVVSERVSFKRRDFEPDEIDTPEFRQALSDAFFEPVCLEKHRRDKSEKPISIASITDQSVARVLKILSGVPWENYDRIREMLSVEKEFDISGDSLQELRKIESARDLLIETLADLSSDSSKELVTTIKDTQYEKTIGALMANRHLMSWTQRFQIWSALYPGQVERSLDRILKGMKAGTDSLEINLFRKWHPIEMQQFEQNKSDWQAIVESLAGLSDKQLIDVWDFASLLDSWIAYNKTKDRDSQDGICDVFISVITKASEPDDIERAVTAWSLLLPEIAETRLRRLMTESSDPSTKEKAQQALIILGGDEATFALLDRQKALQPVKSLLGEVQEESMKQWRDTEHRAQTAFWTSTVLNISTFVVGVVLIGFGLYLMVSSSNPVQTLSGAILSAVSTFATTVSRRFLIEPLEYITRAPAEQSLTQGAFMGFMHQLSEIQLTFEARYTVGQVDIEELERFQGLIAGARRELVEQLRHWSVAPNSSVRQATKDDQ